MQTKLDEEKLELDLEVVLPHVADERDQCIEKLEQKLRTTRGITEAHIKTAEHKAMLCLHYNPALLSLAELKRLTARAGAVISNRYQHQLMPIRGMDCSDCTLVIEHGIKRLDGVLAASVSYVSAVLKIEYDSQKVSESDIKARLNGLGYQVEKTGVWAFYSEQRELIFSGLCGLTLALGWFAPQVDLPPIVIYLLFAASYFFGGYDIARHAIHSIQERQLDTDLLMVLAAVGAASLGEFAEGALLLFLFSLGHALEELALDKARDAVGKLGKLTPKTATVIRSGTEAEVPIDEVQIEEVVIAKPGVRLAVDGIILAGTSAIDQSPITGESVPVEKKPGDQIFAGSVNGSGALQIRVTKLAKDNTLSRVMELVEESQTQKTKTQQITEKFTSKFVPVVLAIDLLLIAVPPVFGMPFREAFFHAMTFLVAVSPCALALGAPSAVLAGIGQAARNGVLIKGGVHLETLGKLQAIAFDKTGTLTRGTPQVTDVLVVGRLTEDESLSVAASCESRSSHPLAAAVIAEAQKRSLEIPAPQSVDSVTGQGLVATLAGHRILVGNTKLMTAKSIVLGEEAIALADGLELDGKTTMFVAVDSELVSIIAFSDTPRPAAKSAVAALRGLGIQQIVLLSGDNLRVASKLAKDVGIEQVKAGLMPEDKVQAMKELTANRTVAMVGDGINDAPALAAASVGIAMGGAATDVALETADVALMGDDLNKLPFAISLGRATRQVVKQNLTIAIVTIIALAVGAISGVTTIGWAIFFHEGSTLLVVANSLRLLRHDSLKHRGQVS